MSKKLPKRYVNEKAVKRALGVSFRIYYNKGNQRTLKNP